MGSTRVSDVAPSFMPPTRASPHLLIEEYEPSPVFFMATWSCMLQTRVTTHPVKCLVTILMSQK